MGLSVRHQWRRVSSSFGESITYLSYVPGKVMRRAITPSPPRNRLLWECSRVGVAWERDITMESFWVNMHSTFHLRRTHARKLFQITPRLTATPCRTNRSVHGRFRQNASYAGLRHMVWAGVPACGRASGDMDEAA